jgi:translation initiation factor IF-2
LPRREVFRRPKRVKRAPVDPAKVVRPTSAEVSLPITVRNLSQAISVKTGDIIKKLMAQGAMATINSAMNQETAQLIALDFGCELKVKQTKDVAEELALEAAPTTPDRPEDLRPRAPVVTFMGHVDHGKTSLLDAIRHTQVAAGEAGGITQHMGAYRVEQAGKAVVFLDTPGHAAFTEMRARGANVTDMVVLVVAADDGVMPQTEEALAHAKAAEVAIVVAVNKVDLPSANIQRAKQQLATMGLNPEEWGGTVGMIEVSAKTGKGIPELIERLALEAELLDLKANPDKPARGTVLEARTSVGRGIVATVLVQEGTLRRGDVILSSHGYGRAKALLDSSGRELPAAGPSMPVEVVGLSELPEAGDRFYVMPDLSDARKIAERRAAERRAASLSTRAHVTLENLSEQIRAGATRELALIVKADVQGSLEVLNKSLGNIAGQGVRTRIVHSGIGGINESDVLLADASNAIVLGFNVAADGQARNLAGARGVELRSYRIIYEIIDDVRKALEGLLAPQRKEVTQGHLEIRRVFSISKAGNVAGCFVVDGFITRSSKVRLARGGTIVYQGGLGGLRRNKDDVREVKEGFECGVKLANYEDIKTGDIIESYEIQEFASKLE